MSEATQFATISRATSFFKAAISAISAHICPLPGNAVAGRTVSSGVQRRSIISATSRSRAACDLPPRTFPRRDVASAQPEEADDMRKSRFTEAQIIGMLKEQEAGLPTSELCRKHGLSSATFYELKANYGGIGVRYGARRTAASGYAAKQHMSRSTGGFGPKTS